MFLACARARAQFELYPRQPSGTFFEVEPSSAPESPELAPPEEPLRWSQQEWNQTREAIESGTFGQELPGAALGEVLASTAAPAPPPAEVEAPQYGTSLSVTGRKVIGFQLNDKRFLQPQTVVARAQDSHLLDLQQQLQIRMQGKVGPKISVNVDYDDTKENKQDISVVYQGDPQEVVQQASFGDINLSLPATEFVSYNKQLFGIRADLKYKKFTGTIIGSRTKGQTHTKQFFGNTQFEAHDIPDVAYIRRQYYDLTFGNPSRLPIQPGSEQVFVDQQNPNPATLPNILQFTADDLAVATATYTGNFQRLAPGQDYTVDYVNGILTMRNPPQPNFVLAVNFTSANGTRLSAENGTGRPKILKTSNDVPISTDPAAAAAEAGPRRELKTFYSLGRNQIIRDDGRGNFVLRVVDQNRGEVGSGLNPAQKYPDTIQVDFENGLFHLLKPFGDPANPGQDDPGIYAPTPISKRLIHAEYHFRFKTFSLEPSLVLNSETVLVDGVKLTRNVDYYIDYEVGFLSFFNPERIGPNSEIDVTYEVAPFGGIGTESLLGARVGYEMNPHWALGSTLLYQAATKPPTTPSIDDLPRSLLVYEADTQLKDLHPFSWLTANLSLEAAQSQDNPNLSGFALIDNMEGVKQIDTAALDKNFWQIASNPQGDPSADPRAVDWSNADIHVLEINPNAQANPTDVQRTLQVNYDFSDFGSTEVSVVFPFSDAGLDFTQKSFLEVVMYAQNDPASLGPQVNFHLGQINEDADGTGGTTLTCANGTTILNAPKTEDTDCDGVLQPSEDIGWLYAPVGKASKRFGGGNGRIDTEDLNHNGRLDAEDLSGCDIGYASSRGCPSQLFDTTAASSITALNYTGWHTFEIPLNITTTTALSWAAIHQIRLSLRWSGPGTPGTGLVRIARIAVVGNTWQPGQVQGGGDFSVGAVNNVDNPNYIPIFSAGGDAQNVFNDLYGSVQQQQQLSNTQNITEQSLELRANGLTPGSTGFTQRTFFHPLDISQHKQLRFLLYGNEPPAATLPPEGSGAVFFLRLGDANNYWETQVPAGFLGWRLVTLNLVDTTGRGIADKVTNASPFNVTILSTGTPNLQQIPQIITGLYNQSPSSISGAVWLDEIHAAQPRARVGNAQKAQADFDIPGWMSFGAKHRYVDRNFQTPVSVIANQDNQQDSGYLNLKRIGWFPMSFTLQRALTNTPNVAQTGSLSNLVNLLQQGAVEHWTGNGQGNFNYGPLPRLNLNYTRDLTRYQLLTRQDDRNVYGGQLSYAVPGEPRLLPRTLDLSYGLTRYLVTFQSDLSKAQPGNFNTDEITNDYEGKAAFSPWPQATFSPSYSLRVTQEKRDDFTSGTLLHGSYPKALNQTAGASLNAKLTSWLAPALNYSVTTIENNNLSTETFTLNATTIPFGLGELKTVNRSANGGISIPLNVGQAFPRLRPFRSLNLQMGYQLQDGEIFQNVEKELDTRGALWIRTPLEPHSPVAQRTNLTLRDTYNSTQRWSPLEAYALPGRWAPFKTLSLTNNYILSLQRTEVTGTPSRSRAITSPDIVASLSQVEALLGTQQWMANTVLNLRCTRRKTEAINVSLQHDDLYGADLRFILKRRFDTSLGANLHLTDNEDLLAGVVTQETTHQDATAQTTFDIRPWRFTPKLDYARDQTKQGGNLLTQDTLVITPSILARADLNLPRGLRLPFGQLYIFTNRIIWTNTLSLGMRRSAITEADNSNLLNFSTSADYELAKNLRMTLNGSLQRLFHKFLPEEDFLAYQLGTTLTFQF